MLLRTALLVAALLAPAVVMAGGWSLKDDCATSGPGEIRAYRPAHWCPITSVTSPILTVQDSATCTWDDDVTSATPGAVTVAAYRLSGGSTVASGAPIAGSPFDCCGDNSHGFLTSGRYIFVASATAANGRLQCSGVDRGLF